MTKTPESSRGSDPRPPPNNRMESGYAPQTLQVPAHIAKAFRDDVSRRGAGSVKVAGTTALAIYMALPEPVRTDLFMYVYRLSWEGAESITPDAVVARLRVLLGDSWGKADRGSLVREVPLLKDDGKPPEPPLPNPETHFVDRIIDPAVKKPKGSSKKTGTTD